MSTAMKTETERTHRYLGELTSVIRGRRYYQEEVANGATLILQRESANPHDPNAIRVAKETGETLGYLPRKLVSWLAPLLDRGLLFLEGRFGGDGCESDICPQIELKLFLYKEGEALFNPTAQPASAREALHQIVLESYHKAAGWEDPSMIHGVGKSLKDLDEASLLSETQLLLSLFPWLEKRARDHREKEAKEQFLQQLSKIDFGDPLEYSGLRIFPLYMPPGDTQDYLLLAQAIELGQARVEEVSQSGCVPEIKAINLGARPVLILEGEILCGAKQNRMVNLSVMLAPFESTILPVACVEQGRWATQSAAFRASHYAPPSMRAEKTASLYRERMHSGRSRCNQSVVWEAVAASLESLALYSKTLSLAEGLDAIRDRTAAYDQHLQLPEGASGVLLTEGVSVIGMDLFESPAPMQALWPRLSQAYYYDALRKPERKAAVTLAQARAFVENLEGAIHPQQEALGRGIEFMIRGNGVTGAALLYEGGLRHLSVFRHSEQH